jgi:ATP-dependent Lhr-like helicase
VRVRDYGPEAIDMLCLSGRVAWGRLAPMDGAGKAPLRSSPIALMLREHAALWRASNDEGRLPDTLTSEARAVHEALSARGALFFHELTTATGILRTQVERALGELTGAGLVTADSFSGLRALLTPSEKRRDLSGRASARRSAYGVDTAGRWALLGGTEGKGDSSLAAAGQTQDAARTEGWARVLLKRYGVVFRSLLARESGLPPWRELAAVYRRLEARGEIRGGRFVSGFGGEQFALPDAVGRLRAIRKEEKSGELVALSAADPLNLVGILTPGARVPAIAKNRVLFHDGLAIAALEGGDVRLLAASDLEEETLRGLLVRRASAQGGRSHLKGTKLRKSDSVKRRIYAASVR